ncbi:MAG TPA: hypothetical protein VMF32_11225 [Xanthobacteraceae bacterium]|nr:hypothetical protein [Xanthobacteraceae bacterium]
MRKSTIGLVAALCLGLVALVLPRPVMAADYGVRGVRTHIVHSRVRTLYCGPCGCLGVTYVYHRVLETTYGLGFDPRNYDTTEPHFYFGPMRAWPRYLVDGRPGPWPCPR